MPIPQNKVAPSPTTDDVLQNDFKPTVSITAEAWKRATSLPLKQRSAELTTLDDALAAYHKYKTVAALGNLSRVYDAWIVKTSQSKPGSARNPELVSNLGWQIASAKAYAEQQAAVNNANKPKINAALDALQVLAQNAIRRTFLDPQWAKEQESNPDAQAEPQFRKIVSKTESAQARNQAADIADIKKAATAIKKARNKPVEDPVGEFKTAFSQLSEGVEPEELFSGDEASKAFFDAASTVIGTVAAPLKLIKAIMDKVTDAYDASKIKEGRNAFNFDPQIGSGAAFDSLIKLLDRDAQNKTVEIVKAVASLGTLAVPVVGQAIGPAINAIVGVAMRAKLLSLERQEMAQAQKLLNEGKVDAGLFQECPLLGCYFLCLADTAVLLSWSGKNDIYSEDRDASIIALKKDAAPAIQRAREYIRKSGYAVEGTQGLKGLEWEPSWRNNKTEYLAKVLTLTSFLERLSKLTNRDTPPSKKEIVDAYYPLLAFDAASLAELDQTDDNSGDEGNGTENSSSAASTDDVYGNVGEKLAAANEEAGNTPVTPDTGIGRDAYGKSSPLGRTGSGGPYDKDDDKDKAGTKPPDVTDIPTGEI
jgi:hypothetical protein